MSEQELVPLLVKLGVVASLASVLVRSAGVKRMLLRETRTLEQRLKLALWFSVVFAAGAATRVVTGGYKAFDLGLEGSLLAGMLGGYFTGLLAGVLISVPAMFHQEYLTMPLFAALGVLGGLVRDCASHTEDVWSFSPFFDLNLYRLFRRREGRPRALFHFFMLAMIFFAEFLRQVLGALFGEKPLFYLHPQAEGGWSILVYYLTTLFAVTLPLKVWNNTRNEMKLEQQQRSLIQARLDALTSQINPHFLFNTLNSVSSLIRTNPQQARAVIYKLSSILRRLLRRHENFSALRDELKFIEDYLSIEVVRFGDKLRFTPEIAPDTLDLPVPTMLLQPLIENSIKHGLASQMEGGTIKLRCERGGLGLYLEVADDGVGIPQAKLATLLGQGIGVSNVSERLKVLYGSNYRMRIDSAPGRGTRIEIEIPEMEPLVTAEAPVAGAAR
ncbi:MAG: histidine kinase [Bryobacterales bacterium]|nr:histidine kinase [Bryobacterales bacterium]